MDAVACGTRRLRSRLYPARVRRPVGRSVPGIRFSRASPANPGRSPARTQSAPSEPAELAGYKALHGSCTSFKPVKTIANSSASFAFACERGTFQLDVNIGAGGKLGGFTGRSMGVTPPAKIGKLFATALALHMNPTWNAATYAEVFPKKQIPEPQARAFAAKLRSQFGTCKAAAFGHELFSWTLDLVCTKNGPLVLAIQLKDDEPIGIQFRPPQRAASSRCPTR